MKLFGFILILIIAAVIILFFFAPLQVSYGLRDFFKAISNLFGMLGDFLKAQEWIVKLFGYRS